MFDMKMDMDAYYRDTATPDQAARDLADFVCSMMRASAADQPESAVTKSCDNFVKLMRTLSYVEGQVSRYELMGKAASLMRERAEQAADNDDAWAARVGTMYYTELCGSKDSFSRARQSKARSRFTDVIRATRR